MRQKTYSKLRRQQLEQPQIANIECLSSCCLAAGPQTTSQPHANHSTQARAAQRDQRPVRSNSSYIGRQEAHGQQESRTSQQVSLDDVQHGMSCLPRQGHTGLNHDIFKGSGGSEVHSMLSYPETLVAVCVCVCVCVCVRERVCGKERETETHPQREREREREREKGILTDKL